MPIIVRSTANRVFIGAQASSSTAPHWRRGWARPPICSIRWSAPWAAMCSQPRRFTAMTRPCRCSIPAVVGPRPFSCGPMCAMTGLPPDRTPPAVWYRYSPDRKGEHPRAHLRAYSGILQADAYAGFTPLYEDGRILEAACWAHARRKHYDLYAADRSPIAAEAIRRIGLLYAIEREIRGCTPEVRTAVGRDRPAPVLDAMHAWLNTPLPNVSAKSPLAGAIHYTLVRWRALRRFCDDARIELGRVSDWRGNHALRGVAVVRQSRCLNPRRGSRFQSLLVEPDMQITRIRLSRMSLRPSLSSRLHDCREGGRGRASHKDTRSDIGGIQCIASLAVVSTIAADARRCNAG